MQVGNKGGLAIKFSLCRSSFCIVNAHLAAHQHKAEARHRDWNKIEQVAVRQNVRLYLMMSILVL
jgi:hypothetical protein